MSRRDLIMACVVTGLVTLAVVAVVFCIFYSRQKKKLQALNDKREGITTGTPVPEEDHSITRPVDVQNVAVEPSPQVALDKQNELI